MALTADVRQTHRVTRAHVHQTHPNTGEPCEFYDSMDEGQPAIPATCHVQRPVLVCSQYRNPTVHNMTNKGTVNVISSEETKESFMPIKRASVKDARKTKTRTAYNTEHTAKTKLALDTAARKKSRLMKKVNAAPEADRS